MSGPFNNIPDVQQWITERAQDCQPLSDELNQIPFAERLEIAKKLQETLGPGKIELKTANHEGWEQDEKGEWVFKKHEHLLDIQCTTKDGRKVDIYNLPGNIDQMPLRPGQSAEHALKSKLNLDDMHSQNMRMGTPSGASIFYPPKR
ncbi:MAG TPA: hypothetical protein V6D17_22525 [Candidatus Obscuribacterales bacterium]